MKLSDIVPKEEISRTIAYHPQLVKVLGSINATIFLCQLLYWTGKESDPNGWIYKRMDQWEKETGLTPEQQATARKKLKTIGVVEELHRRGSINKKYYRINKENLQKLWAASYDIN